MGRFQGNPVPFFFLQQNIFRFLLPVRQILYHIIESVNLIDVRGSVVQKPCASPADTMHQLSHRLRQIPHQEINPQHTESQTAENCHKHPKVKPAAHSEQIFLRVKSQKHPFRMVIWHIVAVQLQRTDDDIDSLSVLLCGADFCQAAVCRFLQKECVPRGLYRI